MQAIASLIPVAMQAAMWLFELIYLDYFGLLTVISRYFTRAEKIMLSVDILPLLSFMVFTVAQQDFEPMNHENWKYLKNDHCDGMEEPETSRIIGGSQARLCEFPWIAGFDFQLPDGLYTRNRCGGTILNSRTILTAAHCFNDHENGMKLTKVYLGQWHKEFPLAWEDGKFAPRVQAIDPKEVIIHADFLKDYFYDIALIRLEEDIQWNGCVNPICVPTGELMKKDFMGEEATAAGWGTESLETGTRSIILRKANFIVTNINDCDVGTILRLEKLICAVAKEKGTDSCRGDSGGPFTIKLSDDERVRHLIIGIISFNGCNQPNDPPLFTRVSAYMEWIMDNLIENKSYFRVIQPKSN